MGAVDRDPEETDARDDLALRFERAAADAGTVVHRAVDAAGAAAVLAALARERGTRRAVAWSASCLGELAAPVAGLEAHGIAITWCPTEGLDPAMRAAFRGAAIAADLGLTGADLGIAASGSVLLCSGPGRARSVSLLPPVHAVVLPRARLVATLADAVPALTAWSHETGATGGANAVLVTGPSRTADIELTLTRGVHGPREVHVVLVGG